MRPPIPSSAHAADVPAAAFEAWAESLARLWLDGDAGFDTREVRARVLLDRIADSEVQAEHLAQLQALSQAYGAMSLSLSNNLAKSTHDHVGAVLEQLRAQPWWRALAIAEAAWGLCTLPQPPAGGAHA